MTGSPLISLPPSPASPAESASGGDGWFPGVDRNAARAALRLGEIVTDDRLIAALEGAALTVSGELTQWQAELLAIGAVSLAAVTVTHLLAMRVPGEYGRYPDAWHDRWAQQWATDQAWTSAITMPYPVWYDRPRYGPARAAWLAAEVDGTTTRLAVIYTRAVRYLAAAELVDLSRDMGATHRGDIRAEARDDPAAEYRRIGAESVRDILGATRSAVELV